MEVFVVSYYDEDGDRVFGVFTSREGADDMVDHYEMLGWCEDGSFHVYKHKLDYLDKER
jgi:hypothetical protein